MPEEIKLSHQDSSVYSDHSDGDASRSENSSCFDESGYCKQVMSRKNCPHFLN
ncbi:hypothetical protein PGB90_004684 [Kerria lacca]